MKPINNAAFTSQLIKKHTHNNARVMQVNTAHGEFTTPCFMPVGTRAFVNLMTPQDLSQAGSQIILGGNTYHMLCAPGLDVIYENGGMHTFMDWQGPMLTDSGGFQVFSLSKNKEICTIDETGARFVHPQTAKIIELNSRSSIQAQKVIGADIIMAFDQCTPEAGGREIALKAMDRTHRWLMQSIEQHQKNPHSAYDYPQALFGIIQGGRFRDLREKSAEFIVNAELDGIAIGGESIGFDMALTREIIDWIRPLLPEQKVRYTMGVGLNPEDLIAVVEKGIDIFDCVAPTRNARHGALYHGKAIIENGWARFVSDEPRHRILIKKTIYANDERPIMEDCACFTCQHHSRAYLHYLCKEKSPSFSHLACIHNIFTMHQVCNTLRQCIMSSND